MVTIYKNNKQTKKIKKAQNAEPLVFIFIL